MAQPAMEESKNIQGETVTKLRILSHDLSNYIETIMQASYLLAQAKLDENNKKWLELDRQSIARCGPSQSRDSRDTAFAKLTVVVDPAELGLPTSEGKTPVVCPTFPCTLTQLLDTCTPT